MTKCLIHRVGAVISRRKKKKHKREEKVCAYMGREQKATRSITQTCNKLFRGLCIKASAISLLAHQPQPRANALSLPCDGSAARHQLLRDNQGILCWDTE